MMSTTTLGGQGPINQHIFPIELIGLFLCTDWAPYDRVVLTNFRSTFDMIQQTLGVTETFEAHSTGVGTSNIGSPNRFDAMSLKTMQSKLLKGLYSV